MSKFNVVAFDGNDELWDSFVKKSHKATFMHTRKFLNYHNDKFEDCSLMIYKDNTLCAVLAAARVNSCTVSSHIGATYSGLITNCSIYGEETIEILKAVKLYYNSKGVNQINYKVTPSLYHATQDEDEIYALFRLNSSLERVDINACIAKSARLKVSSQRKRSFKKAVKNNLKLESGLDNLESFYQILSDNLAEKHSAAPVHSLEELYDLTQRFPKEIELNVVKNKDDKVVSGVVFFNINRVKHAQYIASSQSGYELGGLDYLFEMVYSKMELSVQEYLSFGTSNTNEGRELNQSLYRFKRQFGSGSIAHMFYSI